jgi:hypothetical protein
VVLLQQVVEVSRGLLPSNVWRSAKPWRKALQRISKSNSFWESSNDHALISCLVSKGMVGKSTTRALVLSFRTLITVAQQFQWPRHVCRQLQQYRQQLPALRAGQAAAEAVTARHAAAQMNKVESGATKGEAAMPEHPLLL